jgi:hypothetical protein
MQAEKTIAEVRTVDTPRGNVRYVIRDSDGAEYTTFHEDVGEQARKLQGRRARLEFHQQQRGQYKNVYLDQVAPAGVAAADHPDTDPEEAAWQTAVAAAPWLVGEPGTTVPPEQLYEKLKPFEERVAQDIEHQDEQNELAR